MELRMEKYEIQDRRKTFLSYLPLKDFEIFVLHCKHTKGIWILEKRWGVSQQQCFQNMITGKKTEQ